MRKQAFPVSMN